MQVLVITSPLSHCWYLQKACLAPAGFGLLNPLWLLPASLWPLQLPYLSMDQWISIVFASELDAGGTLEILERKMGLMKTKHGGNIRRISLWVWPENLSIGLSARENWQVRIQKGIMTWNPGLCSTQMDEPSIDFGSRESQKALPVESLSLNHNRQN